MTSACSIGIDLGTSSAKAAVIDGDGVVVSTGTAGYGIDRPRPGWAETHPSAWWEAVRAAVRSALAGAPATRVVGVGLSGQMHGVVLVDASGTPVRPAMLWPDGRAASQVDLYRGLGAPVRARLGNPLVPGMAGPLLAWAATHEPGVLSRARWALQPKDWVRHQLTGELGGEHSDASATLLYDVTTKRWDTEVAESVGVDPALLPPLLAASGEVAGHLSRHAAQELGLDAGVPVAAGAADTAAAALGTGLSVPGDIQMTIGTGVQITTPLTSVDLILTPTPVTHLHRDTSASGWYSMAACLNGGQALDWVRRVLGVDWTELYASAADPATEDAPLFLPHLSGERTPHLDSNMRGAWTGISAHHGRRDLLRAAVEGVAFAIADAYDALCSTAGVRTDGVVRLAGGGTRVPAFQQLLSTAIGAALGPVEATDASVRGAGLLGAVSSGSMTWEDASSIASAPLARPIEPEPSAQVTDRRRRWSDQVDFLRQDGVRRG